MSSDTREEFTRPRPSATVVLLRDASDGPETLLVLRHARASFGASFVFPGGLCEDSDRDVAVHCDGLAPGTTGFDEPGAGTAYYSAGIRELFEESGVLLACRAGNRSQLVSDNEYDEFREAVQNGELAWPAFLQAHDLRLACDRLSYFAWWVTPRRFRKRYSTRFFIARAPEGQDASHDGSELTDSRWLRPADALAADGSELSLPPPTRAVLNDLAQHGSVAEALDWALGQQSAGVDCILPAMLPQADGARVVLPRDSDYPQELRGREE